MNIIKENNSVYILNENNEKIAYVDFPLVTDGVVNIIKTYVSDSLRGNGVAGKLMEATVEVLKKNNYQVIATCSFAKDYLSKNDTGIKVIG